MATENIPVGESNDIIEKLIASQKAARDVRTGTQHNNIDKRLGAEKKSSASASSLVKPHTSESGDAAIKLAMERKAANEQQFRANTASERTSSETLIRRSAKSIKKNGDTETKSKTTIVVDWSLHNFIHSTRFNREFEKTRAESDGKAKVIFTGAFENSELLIKNDTNVLAIFTRRLAKETKKAVGDKHNKKKNGVQAQARNVFLVVSRDVVESTSKKTINAAIEALEKATRVGINVAIAVIVDERGSAHNSKRTSKLSKASRRNSVPFEEFVGMSDIEKDITQVVFEWMRGKMSNKQK